jgi:hypothetical protein
LYCVMIFDATFDLVLELHSKGSAASVWRCRR